MEESPLTIRYTPEADDYVHASRALAKSSKSFIIMAVLLILSIIAGVVVLLIPNIENPGWKNSALILLVVGVFYIFYYFLVIPFQLRRAYKKQQHLKVEREIVLKDEDVSIKIGEGGIDLKLVNLEKVIFAKELYLMVFKDKQNLYFYIPERAFNQDVTKDTFLAYLKSKSIQIS